MRFQDIPRLTQANYRIDVPVRYLEEQFAHYEKSYGLELSPDFQRNHVWTEEQQRKYVEFLLRGGRSGRDILFNCVGFNHKTAPGKVVCVDGLQRLTACRKFVNNELQAFGLYCNEFEDKIDLLLTFVFCINDLPTKKQVLNWYLEINDGGTIHTKEELDKVRNMLAKENV